MALPDPLLALIRRTASRPAAPVVHALAQTVLSRYGDCVQAVLFYGSCLRSGDDRGGMVDLYVIVDAYRRAFRPRWEALLNGLLPPNVYYLEISSEDRVVRAKYAVLSLADLERGVSPAWFHSYLWGRFAQPTVLLFARGPETAERIYAALGRAVVTFLARVLPCLPPRFTAAELWMRGLSLSYRAELRAERPEKVAGLFRAAAGHYEAVTAAARPVLPYALEPLAGETPAYEARIPAGRRLLCRWAWRLRSLQGKVVSLLRLLKGAFTFAGGLDYILWKIERHTGVAVEVPPRLRGRPILALCVLSWRLYRSGAFR